MSDDERRMIPKPAWAVTFEGQLASAIPVHPNLLSAAKLLLLTPLFTLGLSGTVPALGTPGALTLAFLAFAVLDYLDGVVARGRGLETSFGRIFDRVTDYPVLFLFSYYALPVVPLVPLTVKLVFDALLLVLFVLERGSTENRLRTTLSYAALLGLLFSSRGWLGGVFSPTLVAGLLWLGACFSGLVVLHNLRILQKRFIADALSGLNLTCGLWSIHQAYHGHFLASLLLLILGAAFDGFDGAAARRWGGTRFGVYSDDIADGVNYGIAPGAAVYFATNSVAGAVIGASYSLFTVGRLIYFTLNKSAADPNYFSGIPSTSGGLITLSGVILYQHEPLILGALVGVACSLMVSFSSQYRHPARAAAKHPRRAMYLVPLCLLTLTLGSLLGGPKTAVGIVLLLNVAYGFWPMVTAFRDVLASRNQTSN